MRKPAFKAQVDTFTANAEVVDQLEVVSMMSPNPQCHGDPTCRLSKPENRLDP